MSGKNRQTKPEVYMMSPGKKEGGILHSHNDNEKAIVTFFFTLYDESVDDFLRGFAVWHNIIKEPRNERRRVSGFARRIGACADSRSIYIIILILFLRVLSDDTHAF